MMNRLMNGFTVDRMIEGVEYENLVLVFLVWEDKRTYCFVKLNDEYDNMYWYATVSLPEATEEAVDELVNSYSKEYIENTIENFVHLYELDVINDENDENVVNTSFLRTI